MTRLPITAGLSEEQFLRRLMGEAERLGWDTYHPRVARTAQGFRTAAIGSMAKGWPDLTLVRERVIFAELKRDGGALRSEQRQVLALLTASGAEVYVWRPSDLASIMNVLT